jgi:hypothetical protein
MVANPHPLSLDIIYVFERDDGEVFINAAEHQKGERGQQLAFSEVRKLVNANGSLKPILSWTT